LGSNYCTMRMLLEDCWQFKPDLSKSSIVESKSPEGVIRRARRIPGTIAESDVVGGNRRRYPRKVWEANLKDGSLLRQKMAEGSAWGQLEHPKDGIVNLASNMAFHLVEAKLLENGLVDGVIEIYEDLPEGKKLSILMDHGYVPKVSSRGMGSVVRAMDGVDEVDLDYICEGWDAVATPSFTKAVLRPTVESAPASQFPAVGRVSEAAKESPNTGAVKAPLRKDPLMNMTQVRESLPALRSFVPSQATPAQLVEGFARITECHRALSAEQAGDATKAWDCSRLHEELNGIEADWANKLSAPKVEVAKLTESNHKLVAVTEAAVKTVKQYRSQLTESTKKNIHLRKMVEALIGKVRGWNKVCEARGSKVSKLTEQLDVTTMGLDEFSARYKSLNAKLTEANEKLALATAALDLLSETYKADTTKLAASYLTAKYPEAVKDAKVAESLKACKTLKDVQAIQESLKPKAEVKAPVTESPATESAAKTVVTEANTKEVEQTSSSAGRGLVTVTSVQAISMAPTSPDSLEESVKLIRRQSESQKASI